MRSPGPTILAVVLFACPALAHAERLSGTVLDTENLKPVKGAVITVAGAAARGETNEVGRFVINELEVGTLEVHIEADGFEPADETVQLPEGGIDDQVFVLIALGGSGETITVIDKAPPLKQDSPGQQDLERKEITRIPGSRGDPLTSVKSLPGVGAADAGGSGPGLLVIRGSAPEDSVVTIDGIEIPLLYHFFGLQSILPAEFIDRIDFRPGGFGVEQGRATGGVLDIVTRNQEPEEYSGFAELSFINLAAMVQGPISKKHDIYLTAAFRRSAIDFLLPLVLPDDANINFTTAPQYYDGQVRVDWQKDSRNRVSLLGLISFDLLSLVNDNIDPNEPLLTGKFENETSFTRAIASWNHKGEHVDSRVTLAGGTTGFRAEIGGADRYIRALSTRGEMRADATWKASKRFQLRGGVEGRLELADVELNLPLPPGEGEGGPGNFSTAMSQLVDESYTQHIAGAYAAADMRPLPTTTINAGVRVDYFARIDAATLSPRLSVLQQIGKRWSARFAIGQYSRPLQQDESLPDYIDPEIATQYVLGGEYKVAEGIQLTGSGFYTDRRQLVVQDPVISQIEPFNAYVNRGVGRSYGLEGLFRVKRENFFGWLAYTLSRSDRIDGPMNQRRLFDYDQTHNFILVGSYELGNWQFGGRFQYATGVPETPIIGAVYLSDFNAHVPVYGQINSRRLDAQHQLDIRVDRKWKFENWSLAVFLDITNVYAHARTLAFQYNFDYTDRQAIKDIPFVPALGVRGSF